MKKLYTSLLVCLLAAPVFGQITIQSTELNPIIGETFTINQADWISEGNSGVNVTWDLSNLQSTGLVFTIDHSAPPASFPSSTYTMETNVSGQTSLAHVNTGSTGQFYEGIEGGGIVITYQDPMKVMTFPLDETVLETDNFSATFISGGIPFTRAGTSELFVDGSGTLITPEGTFTNVLRVRNDQNYTDTYVGGVITYFSRTYAWYKAGVHYPLASTSELSTDLGSPTQYSAQYMVNPPLSLTESMENQLMVYPNPALSELTLVVSNFDLVDHVEIIDMTGHLVKSNEVNMTNERMTLDITELTEGIYLVSLVGENGEYLSTERIVKK